MLDHLTSMAVFVKAADSGSFTAAATALGLTSQMVGKHVAALEARLGTPLIQRTTRRQHLTQTGQLFYERCRAILTDVAAADALSEDGRAEPQGRLRVSAPVGFGATVLAPIVADFLERYPAMQVELTLTDRYVDLVDEGFDVVLRLGPLAETTLVARELTLHEQVACASPGYITRYGAPDTPADLAAHRCLGFINWSGRSFDEWRFGQNGVIHSVRIRPRFQVNDGRVLVAAAVAGHGIILQPRAVMADALALGSLVPILPGYTAPSRSLYLLFTPQQPQPNKLRAFIEQVITAFPIDHVVHKLRSGSLAAPNAERMPGGVTLHDHRSRKPSRNGSSGAK